MTSFDTLPDAPLRSFDLKIDGGRHGILVVSGADLCKANQDTDATFTGQNGKLLDAVVPMATPCTLAVTASADILVLPSFMEGLPLVIIEAMALGKPVVSSGVAGIPELVRDGENGLLVPPSHWQALAEAMVTLAANGDLRERLGAAGRRAVEAEFSIDRAVRPLHALFSRGKG